MGRAGQQGSRHGQVSAAVSVRGVTSIRTAMMAHALRDIDLSSRKKSNQCFPVELPAAQRPDSASCVHWHARAKGKT
jgi:hypothetical protein